MIAAISSDYETRYCVLGAGTSGLTVLKNFAQRGVAVDCLEREDTIGGNWCYGMPHSSVYRSTHLISSKRLTEYTDFPMSHGAPEFPGHQQVFQYLTDYVRHFDLLPHIQFRTGVQRIEPVAADDPQTAWRVTLASGEVRVYRGVVIANGHNWDPKRPELPGHFAGQILHSADYKTPDILKGRRVLVIGGGNSGCDIAVEAAQHAAATFHSLRRGYHYLPKFLRGKPVDECGERLLRWRLPLWLRRQITRVMVKIAIGLPQQYGLPVPDHRLFETHPIINSQMLYYVGHGQIRPKPDVTELCGTDVRFTDGTREPIDLIILATGFNIRFPFIDEQHLNWHAGRPQLYLHAFHPRYDGLFVAGLIQPDSGQWGLVDYQAQLMARFVAACKSQSPRADWFRRLKLTTPPDLSRGIRYVDSSRHLLEVEHFSYRRRLQKLIAKF